MADQPENLLLELLRQMRGDIATLRNDVSALRTETREGFSRIEVRLTAIEQHMAALLLSATNDRDALQALTRRVERIERRLELSDIPP